MTPGQGVIIQESKSHPPSFRRSTSRSHATNFRSFRKLTICILAIATTIALFRTSEGRPDSSSSEEDWWNKKSKFSFSSKSSRDSDFDFDEDRDTMDGIINIIVGIVVFLIVGFFAFILCLCCPICMLAKMRSRRRGQVYRSVTANGTTVTTTQNRGGTTITVQAPPRHRQAPQATTSPSVIAISNNANQPAKPYPVQQSVTVVPVITPQPIMTTAATGYSHSHNVPYPLMPQPQQPQYHQSYESYPSDLPPPYPGLPREMDNNDNRNLPYNPYYSEAGPQASAPPPK